MRITWRHLIHLLLVPGFLLACRQSTSAQKPDARFEALNESIQIGKTLLTNARQGAGEGTYPKEAFSQCQRILNNASNFMKRSNVSEAQIDSTTDAIYDALTEFEASVHSDLHDLTDNRASKETRYLYDNLKRYAPDYMLFGAHETLGYGVGWSGDDTRSDIKDVCGDYPAVFSWDVYHVFNDTPDDLQHYVFRIKYAYQLGGVTTFCWHQYDPQKKGFYAKDANYDVVTSILPGGTYHALYKNKLKKLARFVKRLRGPKGETLPVIFRPYHEQNGNWFWWGKGHRTQAQFIRLYRFTVHFLRDSLGVHNFIYAFSPDGNQFSDKEGYLNDYPGDDVVDVLGLDFYFGKGNDDEIRRFQSRVIYTVQYAERKNKLPALTEVGDYYGFSGDKADLKIPNWYTRCFLAPIKYQATAKKIAYGAVWRNASKTHHFAPYPGHPSVPDFLDFYKDNFTLFLHDINDMYQFKTPLPSGER